MAQNPQPKPPAASSLASSVAHPAWSRQATVYEVNLRQFTPEGTIKAFAAELPRLQKMGVGILWIMPAQPIGKLNRKGTLGSYYAISDYTAVNPEFGTLDDFRAMVSQAHGLGMKVILDWVANHTAWDHPWAQAHKDWYKLNAQGQIYPVTFREGTPEVESWSDVVALNYDSPALRAAMADAMAFWVKETDIDGFRCDVASLVPTAFWERTKKSLDAIKPMFMLAESDAPELHRAAFDMSYSWDLAELFKAIAQGKAGAKELAGWLKTSPSAYPADAYRMRFTTNHDFNSWNGTDDELYGAAYPALAVLSFTLPGMPLIYGGQEAHLRKRLEFFEKDAIAWKGHALAGFYTALIALKKRQPALAAGSAGAPVEVLETGNAQVFAFRRAAAGRSVTVAVNLGTTPQAYRLAGAARSAPAARTLAGWAWQIDEQHP